MRLAHFSVISVPVLIEAGLLRRLIIVCENPFALAAYDLFQGSLIKFVVIICLIHEV